MEAKRFLQSVGSEVASDFVKNRSILTFEEYIQLFVQSPRTWRFPEHDPADLEAFRSKREAAGLPALVHALYLANLAAPDEAIYSKSVDTMRTTVDAACAIEADAVIFHIGSHLGAGFETGLERRRQHRKVPLAVARDIAQRAQCFRRGKAFATPSVDSRVAAVLIRKRQYQ